MIHWCFLIVCVCTCRGNFYDAERSTMLDNPTYATINDYQLSYNPERSTMLDNPTYATTNDYQVSYNPERSTMLDNPMYSTVKEYQAPHNRRRSSEMIENPGYFALKQQQLQVVMTGNPAYGTALNYNPACLVANRLMIPLTAVIKCTTTLMLVIASLFSDLRVHLEENYYHTVIAIHGCMFFLQCMII